MFEVHLQPKLRLAYAALSPLETLVAIDLEHLGYAKYAAYQLFLLCSETFIVEGQNKNEIWIYSYKYIIIMICCQG